MTTNRVLVSNANGKVAVSAVTATELGYLDGATSNVQTQLNGCVRTSGNQIIAGAKQFNSVPQVLYNGAYRTMAYSRNNAVAFSWNASNLEIYVDATLVAKIPMGFSG